MKEESTGQDQLSFGQQLVGMTFNPSGDPKVQRAKELCAELADIMQDEYLEKTLSSKAPMISSLYETLHKHAIAEILSAQMNVVKVLTFKY